MFAFQCEWLEDPAPPERSGFDLGHMTFTGEQGTFTSKGRTPDQAMMLGIALADLLGGLALMLKGTQAAYRFEGADSSFTVHFEQGKRGRIAVRCGPTVVDEVTARVLGQAIFSEVEAFLARPGDAIAEDDPVHEDLFCAMKEVRRLLS